MRSPFGHRPHLLRRYELRSRRFNPRSNVQWTLSGEKAPLDDLASGYLKGSGGGTLESHFTQEDIGAQYEVAAMQFEQISGDFVAP